MRGQPNTRGRRLIQQFEGYRYVEWRQTIQSIDGEKTIMAARSKPKDKQNVPTVHERMSADLPINSRVSIAIVKDPYSNFGEQIRVLRSVRDDPLAGMFSRSQIDQAQLEAGREWQRHHENSEIGSIRAIDPGKEAVDGGRMPEPITDRQTKAFRQLAIADAKLGQEGCALVRDVLGYRLSITAAAQKRGMVGESEVKYIGKRFRECLETLAILWGFAGEDLTGPANHLK